MKICILGPVETENYLGGVATFDECLANGFLKLGHEVTIITTQKPPSKKKNIEYEIKYCSRIGVFRVLKNWNPQYAIASLDYGHYLYFLKDCTTIYYLHGFFNLASYGFLKTMISIAYQKLLIKKVDYVFTNSHFTSMINRKLWNIRVDKVIEIGIDEHTVDDIDDYIRTNNNSNILYMGRLVKHKRVDRIIESVARLNKENIDCKLIIVGDGPDKQRLIEIGRKNGCNITFLGRISHSEVAKIYRNSEIFISLNESEPYGIVFIEALLNGCKIICPKTGGQNEFLLEYSDRVSTVAEDNINQISIAIKQLLNKKSMPLCKDDLITKYSYETMALKFLNALTSQE